MKNMIQSLSVYCNIQVQEDHLKLIEFFEFSNLSTCLSPSLYILFDLVHLPCLNSPIFGPILGFCSKILLSNLFFKFQFLPLRKFDINGRFNFMVDYELSKMEAITYNNSSVILANYVDYYQEYALPIYYYHLRRIGKLGAKHITFDVSRSENSEVKSLPTRCLSLKVLDMLNKWIWMRI